MNCSVSLAEIPRPGRWNIKSRPRSGPDWAQSHPHLCRIRFGFPDRGPIEVPTEFR